MAFEIPGFSYSLPSAQDWSATNTYRFCNMNASGQTVVPTLGGDQVGVRQNKPRTAEATTLVASGISMVEASAGITRGAWVTCAATGQAVTASTGNFKHGRALETAGGAGELIAVLLIPCPSVV